MKKEKTTKATNALKLVSYTIKATIPTCQYGNIQPEITVMAGTIEEAESFVLPHINKLYEVYAEIPRDGKPLRFIKQPAPVVTQPVMTTIIPISKTPILKPELGIKKDTLVEQQSEALARTLKIIESCKNKDLLESINVQIITSVKLTQDEKVIALAAIKEKNV